MADDEFHRNYRAQKAALTRAEHTGNPATIIATAGRGLTSFERYGYPDDWSRWQRALDDAMLKRRMQSDRWRRKHPKSRGERIAVSARHPGRRRTRAALTVEQERHRRAAQAKRQTRSKSTGRFK